MSNFYQTVIRPSAAFSSDAVCKDMGLLEPGTRQAVLALMDEAKHLGHDLRVLETYRSQARQTALFRQHATQLSVVGCHGFGVAVDFGVFINGKYAEDNTPYVFLRELARKYGLISGQDWGHLKTGNFVDSGHVQRPPVWRQAALFNGSWYPPENYDPYIDSMQNGHPDISQLSPNAPAPVIPKPLPSGFVAPPLVRPGSSGVDVNRLQSMLEVKVTGQYAANSETEWALRLFQVRHGLNPDGACGAATWAALMAKNST